MGPGSYIRSNVCLRCCFETDYIRQRYAFIVCFLLVLLWCRARNTRPACSCAVERDVAVELERFPHLLPPPPGYSQTDYTDR